MNWVKLDDRLATHTSRLNSALCWSGEIRSVIGWPRKQAPCGG